MTAVSEDSPVAKALAEMKEEEKRREISLDEFEQGEPETPELHDSELDDVEKQVGHRDWPVKGIIVVQRRPQDPVEEIPFERTYTQKPLSFGAMLQFTGLIGNKLTRAMDEGMTIQGVLNDDFGFVGAGVTQGDFANIDAFVRGLAKMADIIPDLIEDCQCIWLRIPIGERPVVKEIWSRSPEDGGLTVKEGSEMLETFIAQNYEEVDDFFNERLPRLTKRWEKLRALKNRGRQPSKPSSTTPQDTPSQ